MRNDELVGAQSVDQLSSGIDALHNGKYPDDISQENEKLLRIALQVKMAASDPEIPPIPKTLYLQAAEVAGRKSQRTQRLAAWASGIAAVAAAVMLFHAYHYDGSQSPPVAYNQDQTGGEPQNNQESSNRVTVSSAETSRSAVPDAPAEPAPPTTPPAAGESKSDAETAKPAPSAGTPSQANAAADEHPDKIENDKTSTMLVLAGLKPDSVTVNSSNGTVRSVYHAGQKDEIVVTQADHPAGSVRTFAAKAGLPQASGGDGKVTVVRHDKEITLEGKLTKSELLKLADSLVPENETGNK